MIKGVATLESLINQSDIDVAQYGKKTQELAQLVKLLPKQLKNMHLTIPPGFTVPTSIAIDDHSIEPLLTNLIAQSTIPAPFDPSPPVALMVRSSDPNEQPGIYESTPIIHDPTNPTVTLKNWQNAANVVRDSGAKAIFTQQVAAEYAPLSYNLIESKRNVFGSDTIGFVANSWSVLSGPNPVILYAWGLPSKIIRGDNDICMMVDKQTPKGDVRPMIINANQDYWHTYQPSSFKQKTIDVLSMDNPLEISTLRTLTRPLFNYDWVDFSDTFEDGLFQLPHMLQLIKNLRKELDCELELEGTITSNKINFVQLRKYSLPKMSTITLSTVDEDMLIASGSGFGYGRFVGDLYLVYQKDLLPTIPQEGIIHYYNESNAIVPKKYDGLANRLLFACPNLNGYRGSSPQHEIGLAIQNVVDFENRGVHAIGVQDFSHNALTFKDDLRLRHRITIEEFNGQKVYKLHNITAECAGDKYQIFFNRE